MATWGPTNSTQACGSDSGGYLDGGWGGTNWVDEGDNSGGWHSMSVRFVNLTMEGTISSATLTFTGRANDNSGANGTLQLRALASNNPAAFSTGDRPYARTHRTTSANATWGANSTDVSVDVTTILQDLITGAGYTFTGSGNGVGFTVGNATPHGAGLGTVSWRNICGGNTSCTLSITYSAGGGVIVRSPRMAKAFGKFI